MEHRQPMEDRRSQVPNDRDSLKTDYVAGSSRLPRYRMQGIEEYEQRAMRYHSTSEHDFDSDEISIEDGTVISNEDDEFRLCGGDLIDDGVDFMSDVVRLYCLCGRSADVVEQGDSFFRLLRSR